MKTWVLRGANRWADVPLLEVELNSPCEVGILRRLGGLVLEYQRLCGSDVRCCDVVTPGGQQRLVIEFEEEAIVRAALDLALAELRAEAVGQSFDAAPGRAALLELAYDVRLGPSTGAIVRAARQRGIPFRRLNSESLVQFGHGCKQRRICTAETDRTSAIAEAIAQDKDLTRDLLRAVGVAVPEGRVVASAEEAWSAAVELGTPVVVKPRDGNHGRGVATNLTSREQVERAFAAARAISKGVMVEQHIHGDDYRLLVVGERLVAAARREPAHVIGDGRSTVRALVDEANKDPRRSDGHSTSLSFLKLDAVSLGVLIDQGLTPDCIPAAGQRVLIRRNGNLSTGGTATDVTDDVHPEIAACAVAAARVIGLDIAGIDLIATDVSRTMTEQHAAIVEVNAGPGLRMHLDPSAGRPRPVGEAIVAMLFPEGATGRIPLVAVTGADSLATSRLTAHLLRRSGHAVGLACAEGTHLDGRRIDRRDGSGCRGARGLLLNPAVTAAVLETSSAGIVHEGLGFDRCDVAIVTRSEATGFERVVLGAIAAEGVAVLDADDPQVRELAGCCSRRTLLFTRGPYAEASHRAAGQSVLALCGQELVFWRDGIEAARLVVDWIARGQEGSVLAAVAAALALGLSAEIIEEGLRSFLGDRPQTPLRLNVVEPVAAPILVE